MSYPDIPPRLWLIQEPTFYRNVALVESNTPPGACDKAARLLKINVGPFRSMSTESGRRIDQDGIGQVLIAVNVTGVLTLADAVRLDDPEVIAKVIHIDDAETLIAPDN